MKDLNPVFSLTGTDCLPPVNGGYLTIKVDGEELFIVSAPSMVPGADRYRDSVTENSESTTDSEGNQFTVTVQSSNTGVDWELTVASHDETLKHRVTVEYQANDY